MNCKDIQKLLITDYLDEQLPAETQREVERHLSECELCIEHAFAIKKTTFEPFNELNRAKPSQDVWIKIKNTIEQENMPQKSIAPNQLREKLKNIWPNPRLAYAAGAFTVILLTSALLFQIQTTKHQKITQFNTKEQLSQVEYITQLASENNDLSEETEENYGNIIEEFFLSKK